jgi:hypothetical protein
MLASAKNARALTSGNEYQHPRQKKCQTACLYGYPTGSYIGNFFIPALD